jgi:arylsulfatase A-like enzyme
VSDFARRVARVGIVVLALLVASLASIAGVSACGSRSPARRSLVVVTIDTLRPDHVTATVAPALTRLAEEAVVFDNAISVGPLTLPGHASLLTGQYPPQHGIRDNHLFALDLAIPTYTSLLKSRGYDTAAFVSAVVLDRRYGLAAGFDLYDDAIPGEQPERAAADTLAAATAWLQRRTAAEPPFFVWIHLFEPHAPYLTGSYAAEVSLADRELGRFFETLRARGFWEKAVLSVTSDHGESLGEHGEDTHGFFVYDSTIRIPWILKAPALKPGRFAPQARIVDVLPTMMALAETAPSDAPGLPAVEGHNLAPDLQRGHDPALTAYAETFLPRHQFNWSELTAIRTPDLKFIEAPDAELYRLRGDPGETRNLAAAEAALAARMRQAVPAAGRAATHRAQADAVQADRLMSLGYLGHAYTAPLLSGAQRPDPKSRLGVYRLVMSALTLSESGRANDALEALTQAEREEPDLVQVHYLKGVILGGQGRYGEAARALERTISLSPSHLGARFKLALALLRLGDHAQAERILLDVVADEPRKISAHQKHPHNS